MKTGNAVFYCAVHHTLFECKCFLLNMLNFVRCCFLKQQKHLHKLFYIQFLFQFNYSHCGTTIWGESTISYSRHVHCSYLNNNTSSLITQAFERHSITPLSTDCGAATLTQDHWTHTTEKWLKLVTVCKWEKCVDRQMERWEWVWLEEERNKPEFEWVGVGRNRGGNTTLTEAWLKSKADRPTERESLEREKQC